MVITLCEVAAQSVAEDIAAETGSAGLVVGARDHDGQTAGSAGSKRSIQTILSYFRGPLDGTTYCSASLLKQGCQPLQRQVAAGSNATSQGTTSALDRYLCSLVLQSSGRFRGR